MNAEVIPFDGMTTLDLKADLVLENLKGKLDGFVLAGYDKDGGEFFSSTYADNGTVLWLIERFKTNLLGDE